MRAIFKKKYKKIWFLPTNLLFDFLAQEAKEGNKDMQNKK